MQMPLHHLKLNIFLPHRNLFDIWVKIKNLNVEIENLEKQIEMGDFSLHIIMLMQCCRSLGKPTIWAFLDIIIHGIASTLTWENLNTWVPR
jgi:hypothetical protein